MAKHYKLDYALMKEILNMENDNCRKAIHILNRGKLSDLSCYYLLMSLEIKNQFQVWLMANCHSI